MILPLGSLLTIAILVNVAYLMAKVMDKQVYAMAVDCLTFVI